MARGRERCRETISGFRQCAMPGSLGSRDWRGVGCETLRGRILIPIVAGAVAKEDASGPIGSIVRTSDPCVSSDATSSRRGGSLRRGYTRRDGLVGRRKPSSAGIGRSSTSSARSPARFRSPSDRLRVSVFGLDQTSSVYTTGHCKARRLPRAGAQLRDWVGNCTARVRWYPKRIVKHARRFRVQWQRSELVRGNLDLCVLMPSGQT